MTDKKQEEDPSEDARSTQELPPDERLTEDMDDEEAPGEGLSPEAQRELATVLRGMEKLARLIEQRDSFSAGAVTFKFLRILAERSNGVQVLLFERGGGPARGAQGPAASGAPA